jgi:hypothetical protein
VRVICEDAPRYSGAEALADDIRRYLGGQAILARPPSTVYRLQKLIRKHRLPSVLVALVILLLAAIAVTQSVQRSGSDREALRAERRGDFLQNLLVSLNPKKVGRTPTLTEVLTRALGDIRCSSRRTRLGRLRFARPSDGP